MYTKLKHIHYQKLFMEKACVIIPCRYSSSRFMGKPLSKLNKKYLMEYPYLAAKKAKNISEVFIATDDSRIAEVCKNLSMKFIMTHNKHFTGSDRIAEAIKKLRNKYSLIINVQGDEPFISNKEIEKCERILRENRKFHAINGLARIEKIEDTINAGVVKAVLNEKNEIIYFSRQTIPYPHVKVKSKVFYRQLGLYGFRDVALKTFRNNLPGPLERCESVEMLRLIENRVNILGFITKINGLAVDTKSDLELAKRLINKNNAKK